MTKKQKVSRFADVDQNILSASDTNANLPDSSNSSLSITLSIVFAKIEKNRNTAQANCFDLIAQISSKKVRLPKKLEKQEGHN